jgi:hypothetical protein
VTAATASREQQRQRRLSQQVRLFSVASTSLSSPFIMAAFQHTVTSHFLPRKVHELEIWIGYLKVGLTKVQSDLPPHLNLHSLNLITGRKSHLFFVDVLI